MSCVKHRMQDQEAERARATPPIEFRVVPGTITDGPLKDASVWAVEQKVGPDWHGYVLLGNEEEAHRWTNDPVFREKIRALVDSPDVPTRPARAQVSTSLPTRQRSCLDCSGTNVQMTEGCETCLDCGWSKCE